MTKKKVDLSINSEAWIVFKSFEGNELIAAAFSTKEEAEYFSNEVYVDDDLCLTWVDKKSTDSSDMTRLSAEIDLYKKGNLFVYLIRLNIYPDEQDEKVWSNNFIGYSMDLTDRKGIIFSYAENEYEVIILATNYKDALELGKKFITEAIEYGPFKDGDYKRPGFIKGWS